MSSHLVGNNKTYSPVSRLQRSNAHRSPKHVPRTQIKSHAYLRALNVPFALNDDGLSRSRDSIQESERERDDSTRLVRAQRCPYHVQAHAQQETDFPRRRLIC